MADRPRREHRRVHHPKTNCRCPEGTKRIETCSKKGDAKCRGRNIGCIDMVLLPGARKPVPRFVKLICDAEAGKVEQWKPPKGYRKDRKRKKKKAPAIFMHPSAEYWQTHLFRPEPTQAQMSYERRTTTPPAPLPTHPTVEELRSRTETPLLPFGYRDLPLFRRSGPPKR